jgi:hypothetical protein
MSISNKIPGLKEHEGKVCPFCQTTIDADELVVICSDCQMPHHAECWRDNGRCTTYGCNGIPRIADPFREQLHESLIYDIEPGVQVLHGEKDRNLLTNYRALVDNRKYNPYVRKERDRENRLIPREYSADFKVTSWSWVAFCFPTSWYFYKGMYNRAWKFILLGVISWILCILSAGSLWYVGLISNLFGGFMGYREYSEFINTRNTSQITVSRWIGIVLIFVSVVLWLLALTLIVEFFEHVDDWRIIQ